MYKINVWTVPEPLMTVSPTKLPSEIWLIQIVAGQQHLIHCGKYIVAVRGSRSPALLSTWLLGPFPSQEALAISINFAVDKIQHLLPVHCYLIDLVELHSQQSLNHLRDGRSCTSPSSVQLLPALQIPTRQQSVPLQLLRPNDKPHHRVGPRQVLNPTLVPTIPWTSTTHRLQRLRHRTDQRWGQPDEPQPGRQKCQPAHSQQPLKSTPVLAPPFCSLTGGSNRSGSNSQSPSAAAPSTSGSAGTIISTPAATTTRPTPMRARQQSSTMMPLGMTSVTAAPAPAAPLSFCLLNTPAPQCFVLNMNTALGSWIMCYPDLSGEMEQLVLDFVTILRAQIGALFTVLDGGKHRTVLYNPTAALHGKFPAWCGAQVPLLLGILNWPAFVKVIRDIDMGELELAGDEGAEGGKERAQESQVAAGVTRYAVHNALEARAPTFDYSPLRNLGRDRSLRLEGCGLQPLGHQQHLSYTSSKHSDRPPYHQPLLTGNDQHALLDVAHLMHHPDTEVGCCTHGDHQQEWFRTYGKVEAFPACIRFGKYSIL
ncbi:hypothetical protein DFH06DRAFT_1142878 [Mycena polygramma]|nr:hypothetical protein DFH06DRAFT_1142878 [Mycena polygramma]